MDASTDATLEVALQLGFVNDAETQARLSPPLRRLHRAVLQAFLDGPEPPSIAWLAQTARRMSLQSEDAIAGLAEVDLVHLGEDDQLAGQAADQAAALELADRIFGGLLDE